jgi:diguanylate cyclase (GGDEF)-like protein
MNFSILPNLIALTILVAVFWAISQRATTGRLYLWSAGWVLVLLHFAAQFLAVSQGLLGRVTLAVSLDCLVLASIAFLVSVLDADWMRRQQAYLAAALSIPTLAYTNGVIWEISTPTYYYLVVATGVVAPLLVFISYRRCRHLCLIAVIAATLFAGGATGWTAAHNNADLGISIILCALYLAVAVLYWRRYRRVSAGVMTAVGGFFLWASVFPTSALLLAVAPSVHFESEVWNIPKYLVAVGMILTLLEEQIARSNYLAYHDELTGLPNRRLLEDRLNFALSRANRTGSKIAVLQIDLDRFKEVNDTFGHHAGDVALQEIVARLVSRLRASDTLARSGGDEFTVVSYVADRAGAVALVSALESALAAPIAVHGEPMQVGLSIGLALYPHDGTDPTQLHAAADRAMYRAKRAARATGTHDPSPPPAALHVSSAACEPGLQ